MLTGQNGILTQAQNAKNRTEEAKVNESNALTSYEQIINASTGVNLGAITGDEKTNTVTQDSLGNRVVVPAGFTVQNPNDNVEDGIIIIDSDENRATYGSEFVWIPVGENIKKKDGTTFDITLGRYVYKEDGTIDTAFSKTEPTDQLKYSSTDSIYYTKGQKDSSTTNTHSKDIVSFISKVGATGGYYIARYEARTETQRTEETKDEALTQLTVKSDESIYNYVTQPQAASLSRNMYVGTNFTSDLMNSYTWDTTIDFLQKCDDREGENKTPYSRQTSLYGGMAEKGTIGTDKEDKICNIYDMARNCYEWSTETSSNGEWLCVARGGCYNDGNNTTSFRYGTGISYSNIYGAGVTFRPILYL